MKVIINADDLGLSGHVNEAVFDLMGRGGITSATILANAPATADAVARLREYPKCSFGVHLNATELSPLTSNAALGPLLQDGQFIADRIRSVKITPLLREAVANEWIAQVQKLIDLGHKPSHIDSHHHVHTVPGLFPALKAVQKRFGIRKVRISLNLYGPDEASSALLLVKKHTWNIALRWYHLTRTTRIFTSFAGFHDWAMRGRKFDLPTMELMVHPGGKLFEAETQLLYTAWRDRLAFPVELISYNDL